MSEKHEPCCPLSAFPWSRLFTEGPHRSMLCKSQWGEPDPDSSPRIHSRFSLAVLPAVIAETAQKPGLDAAHICPCLTFYSQKTMLNQMVNHLRVWCNQDGDTSLITFFWIERKRNTYLIHRPTPVGPSRGTLLGDIVWGTLILPLAWTESVSAQSVFQTFLNSFSTIISFPQLPNPWGL